MNKTQLLLVKLAEEGAEIAQIALKTAQFGLLEEGPGQPFSNAERTHQEIDDLVAVVELLNEHCAFGYQRSQARIDAKKEKVAKYAEYSNSLGMVKL